MPGSEFHETLTKHRSFRININTFKYFIFHPQCILSIDLISRWGELKECGIQSRIPRKCYRGEVATDVKVVNFTLLGLTPESLTAFIRNFASAPQIPAG